MSDTSVATPKRRKSARTLAKARKISVAQVELLRQTRSLTDEGIEKLPQKTLMRAVRRADYADMARRRIAFQLEQAGLQSKEEHGNRLLAAVEQLNALRARVPRGRRAGMPVGGAVPGPLTGVGLQPVAGLARKKWRALGPRDIGGRTRAILIHPTEPDTIWIASVGGGVWRSDNGGGAWAPVDDFMGNLAVTSLVMDPTDASTIYAGTGEGFGNMGALRGAGVFRTTDGVTWERLGGTDAPAFRETNRLAISADGAVLLAATRTGLYRSDDAARANWRLVLNAPIADVKCDPKDPKKALTGSLDSGFVWWSDDTGLTWKQSTHAGQWSGRVEVCYAAADSATVYASVNASNGEIWRSSDGGRSFTKRKSKLDTGAPSHFLGDQGWYGNAIWAGDPTDKDLVIVGGIDLWRSLDGGDTLVDISTWWDSKSAHADHHTVVAHPLYDGLANHTVFFGNDGGIWKADDVTTVGDDADEPRVSGWVPLNNDSYGVTQFYGGAVNSKGVIVCGAQDNGTLAYHPDTDKWVSIFGGDGGFCAADPSDDRFLYGEYVYLNIFRNTDGAAAEDPEGYISGQYWNARTGNWDWKRPPYVIPDAYNETALFIAPFVLDPNNPETILGGGQSLWRTTDARAPNTTTKGPKWHSIKAPSAAAISAVAIDAANSDRVWVGHTNGEVWKSLDATKALPSWRRMDSRGSEPLNARRWCHQICVSPQDPKCVLAVFGEFVGDNVWFSSDDGETWKPIADGLPEAPVRAVAFNPKHAGWIYVGTEVGVFASEDMGASWSPTNEGPANVSVDDLIWHGQTLICITHGRGVFSIDLV